MKYVYILEGKGPRYSFRIFSLDGIWSMGKPFVEIDSKDKRREDIEKVMNRLLKNARTITNFRDLGDKITILEVSDKVYRYVEALGTLVASGRVPEGFWEELARLPEEELKKRLDLLVLKLKLEPGWEL